jgi:hypothetical protein
VTQVLVGAALALAAGGCEAPDAKSAASGPEVRPAEAARLCADARKALDHRSFDVARETAMRAHRIGGKSERADAEQIIARADAGAAELFANEMRERLDAKDCAGAIAEIDRVKGDLSRETFVRALRSSVGDGLLACVRGTLAKGKARGSLGKARALVTSPATRALLGEAAFGMVSAELDEAVAAELGKRIAEDVRLGRLPEAMKRIDAAVQGGEATAEQAAPAVEQVRRAVAVEIEAIVGRTVGERDGKDALARIDELAALVRWDVDTTYEAPDPKRAMPEAVKRRRDVLLVWNEALRVKMKPSKKADRRYTHGRVAVLPAEASDAEARGKLAAAAEVWVIGTSRDKALVARAEPSGPLAIKLEKAIGWVPLSRLSFVPTNGMLPPDDELVGARVWGPLGSTREALLELGTVTRVDGKDALVQPLADRPPVKVAVHALKSGYVAVGTRVVATCAAKTQRATVVDVLGDDRDEASVRVACDDGTTAEVALGSLTTRPELLVKQH